MTRDEIKEALIHGVQSDGAFVSDYQIDADTDSVVDVIMELLAPLHARIAKLEAELDDLAALRAGAWYSRLVKAQARAEAAEARIAQLEGIVTHVNSVSTTIAADRDLALIRAEAAEAEVTALQGVIRAQEGGVIAIERERDALRAQADEALKRGGMEMDDAAIAGQGDVECPECESEGEPWFVNDDGEEPRYCRNAWHDIDPNTRALLAKATAPIHARIAGLEAENQRLRNGVGEVLDLETRAEAAQAESAHMEFKLIDAQASNDALRATVDRVRAANGEHSPGWSSVSNEVHNPDHPDECAECGRPWPCQGSVIAAALDQQGADLGVWTQEQVDSINERAARREAALAPLIDDGDAALADPKEG